MKNKDDIKEYQAKYREANRDKTKAYYQANKDKIKAKYEANKDKIKAKYEANKDDIKEYQAKYREANRDKAKAYYQANKDNFNAISKEKNKNITYETGKIYEITSIHTTKKYIGSTKYPLKIRLTRHKAKYKQNDSISSKEIIKLGDYKISLICLYQCNTRAELEAEEQRIIDTYDKGDLVNKNKAYNNRSISKEERRRQYRIDNKDKRRQYKQDNKDHLNAIKRNTKYILGYLIDTL